MFESSNPKQRYLVINRVALTSKQERVLIKLYQPLVASLGVEKVVLTNACGGINREFAPGTLMLITCPI